MRRWASFACLLTLLALTWAPALAAPEGCYVIDLGGQQEGITATADTWVSEVSLPEAPEPYREEAPIAARIEPEEGRPGRLVLGPLPDRVEPYEVVWFLPGTPETVRLHRDGRQHATLEAALQAPAPQAFFRRYWAAERFAQLADLPTMEKPDRAALLALGREALRRVPPHAGSEAVDETMEDLMIEKGQNPFSSRMPFVEARRELQEDPEVKALLQQLEDRVRPEP